MATPPPNPVEPNPSLSRPASRRFRYHDAVVHRAHGTQNQTALDPSCDTRLVHAGKHCRDHLVKSKATRQMLCRRKPELSKTNTDFRAVLSSLERDPLQCRRRLHHCAGVMKRRQIVREGS